MVQIDTVNHGNTVQLHGPDDPGPVVPGPVRVNTGEPAGGYEPIEAVPPDVSGKPVLEAPDPGAELSESVIELLLLKFEIETTDEEVRSSVNEIAHNRDLRAKYHQKVLKKIKKAEKKQRKAKRKAKKLKAFKWVGVVVSFVLAGAAMAMTGGAAAPLVAVAALNLMDASLGEAGEKGIGEGLGKAFEQMGMGEKAAQITGQVVYAAALVAISFGGSMPTGLNQISTLCSASVKAGEGTVMLLKAELDKDISMLESARMKTEGKKIGVGADIDDEMERVREFYAHVQEAVRILVENLNSKKDTGRLIAQNMGQNPGMVHG